MKATTIEYRTPGAFYLRTPKLARGLLGLSLLITENLVSKIKVLSNNFTRLPELTPEELQDVIEVPAPEYVLQVLKSREASLPKRCLDQIKESLGALPNFKDHAVAISEFFREVDEDNVPSPDLLVNWRKDL